MSTARPPGAARQSWTAARSVLATGHHEHHRFYGRMAVAGLIPQQMDLEHRRTLLAKQHELERVREAFVSSISHELRTPLTSILGFLHLVQNDEGQLTAADRAHMLGLVQASSQDLLLLVDDLLTLSQIEEGLIPLEREPTSLMEILMAALGSFPEAEMARVEFDADPGLDVTLTADAAQLGRAFANILGNALKFTPAAGSIRLDVTGSVDGTGADGPSSAEAVDVTVADTGIGIPASEQGELFSRFFRSSLTREDHAAGMGIGLVVTSGIVRGHGGSVSVESAPGAGTTVRVRLPLR